MVGWQSAWHVMVSGGLWQWQCQQAWCLSKTSFLLREHAAWTHGQESTESLALPVLLQSRLSAAGVLSPWVFLGQVQLPSLALGRDC